MERRIYLCVCIIYVQIYGEWGETDRQTVYCRLCTPKFGVNDKNRHLYLSLSLRFLSVSRGH